MMPESWSTFNRLSLGIILNYNFMKGSNWLVVLLLITLVVVFIYLGKKDTSTPNEQADGNDDSSMTTDALIGCYVVDYNKDVYTLNIMTHTGDNISGTLVFDNYQKDSSRGTFTGTYKDGLLLADYSFQSEGMDSLMQVAFKKTDDGFVRGYGPVDAEGTHFTDISKLEFDASAPLSLFESSMCVPQ